MRVLADEAKLAGSDTLRHEATIEADLSRSCWRQPVLDHG
jgi:hypothetical protein